MLENSIPLGADPVCMLEDLIQPEADPVCTSERLIYWPEAHGSIRTLMDLGGSEDLPTLHRWPSPMPLRPSHLVFSASPCS